MLCLLFLSAFFPSLYWDKGADIAPALKQAGIDRVYVPDARVAAWSNAGVEAIGVDPATLTKLATPGVQYRMNEASATSVPWIDANGWRYPRSSHSITYY